MVKMLVKMMVFHTKITRRSPCLTMVPLDHAYVVLGDVHGGTRVIGLATLQLLRKSLPSMGGALFKNLTAIEDFGGAKLLAARSTWQTCSPRIFQPNRV